MPRRKLLRTYLRDRADTPCGCGLDGCWWKVRPHHYSDDPTTKVRGTRCCVPYPRYVTVNVYKAKTRRRSK